MKITGSTFYLNCIYVFQVFAVFLGKYKMFSFAFFRYIYGADMDILEVKSMCLNGADQQIQTLRDCSQNEKKLNCVDEVYFLFDHVTGPEILQMLFAQNFQNAFNPQELTAQTRSYFVNNIILLFFFLFTLTKIL